MRKLLINALSVTNQSGLHVLLGHGNRLLAELSDELRLVVLCRENMAALRAAWGERVDWVFAPPTTAGWRARSLWEYRHLRPVVTQAGADAYFTPSGVAAPSLPVPQLVFCQNPWALVATARRWRDAPKAWLQRQAYRRTMQVAEIVIFNSRFMQEAYRQNAGRHANHECVVYQAPEDSTHERALAWRDRERKPGQIACVSAMGPHKNVETVVRAVAKMRDKGMTEVSLQLVGGWPDPAYEGRIRRLVAHLQLGDVVRFSGFVSREELDRYLAESQVFCLMSRCESFGIPAIETQLFGTPVISSNVCAVPEICGDGGWFYDPDDDAGVADGLARLLGDKNVWQEMSQKARINAERFIWKKCSLPLVDLVRKVVCG